MLHKRGKYYHAKFKAGGQTYQRSTRATSLRKAQEFEREYRQQVARELHEHRTGKPVKRTYGEALIRWVNEGAPKSMFSHARNTRPYLESTPLHLVPAAANQMKGEMLSRGLSVQTINRRLAVVRRVLNVAYTEWDWISQPLGMKIKLLSEKGMEREFYLSREEVEQLASAIQSETARNVVLVAAYTGLRKSEILSLKPENWQEPYIILPNKTKSKKPRTVPVIEEMQKCLTLPFRISDYDLRKEFEAARESIQRPDIRFHDLRHTFASWLAKDPNVPLTTLRDLLGHSNLTVTSRYAHLRGNTHSLVESALRKKG